MVHIILEATKLQKIESLLSVLFTVKLLILAAEIGLDRENVIFHHNLVV